MNEKLKKEPLFSHNQINEVAFEPPYNMEEDEDYWNSLPDDPPINWDLPVYDPSDLRWNEDDPTCIVRFYDPW